MIRSAAAFGADFVLLGQGCCSPWYRRAVRTSMGHVFSLPVVTCDLPAALRWLAAAGVASYGAVIDHPSSELRTVRLQTARGWCLVMGNEDTGLSPQCRAACSGGGLRIPMAPGVDSLNVGVAAGILLNGLVEREPAQGEDEV